MSHFRIYIPTRTLFGAGMVKELHNQQLPGKKAMIVISNGRSTTVSYTHLTLPTKLEV